MKARLARIWTACRSELATFWEWTGIEIGMTRRRVIAVIVVSGLIGYGIFHKIELNDAHDRARDRDAQLRDDFLDDLRAYDIANTQFTACLNSVNSRNALREALFGQNTLVNNIVTVIDNYVPEQADPLIKDLYAQVTTNATQIATDYAAYPADHCPASPPKPPVPPDGLFGEDFQIPTPTETT